MKKLNKNKISIIIITMFLIIVAIAGVFHFNIVKAASIEEYQNQIKNNSQKIEISHDIKEQLHITAELLRAEGHIDNGLSTILSQKWLEYDAYQLKLREQNDILNKEIAKLKSQKTLIGYFKITHYCPCSKCNGGYTGTAIGTRVTAGRTIAVDPRVIPLKSKVEINGRVYIAEDTGGAIKGNRIDVAVSSHSEAMRLGVLYDVPVYKINKM